MTNEILSFEKAFERLELILETMNAGKTPLEESLKLFEEAEQLIRNCTGRLNSAEQKIEMLIKGRNGEVSLDAEQKPKTENYARRTEEAAAPARTPPVSRSMPSAIDEPPAFSNRTPPVEPKPYSKPLQTSAPMTMDEPPAFSNRTPPVEPKSYSRPLQPSTSMPMDEPPGFSNRTPPIEPKPYSRPSQPPAAMPMDELPF